MPKKTSAPLRWLTLTLTDDQFELLERYTEKRRQQLRHPRYSRNQAMLYLIRGVERVTAADIAEDAFDSPPLARTLKIGLPDPTNDPLEFGEQIREVMEKFGVSEAQAIRLLLIAALRGYKKRLARAEAAAFVGVEIEEGNDG